MAGTTLHGGVDDSGIAYTLEPGTQPGTWKKTKLHDFGTVPDDVVTPDLELFSVPEGLYGVDQGGANGTGAFYLLTRPTSGKGAWAQNILFSFLASGSGDAALPGGEPIRDASGNFFGVTALGGVNNLGAVYELSPPAVPGDPWTEAVLYSFNGTRNASRGPPLARSRWGALGTANGGGDSGAGLVFELDPPAVPGDHWTENILHAFTGGSDGGSPANGVIADKRGRLFGTAGGTVFMLQRHSRGGAWTETVLHSFSVDDESFRLTHHPLQECFVRVTAQGGTFGTGTAFKLTLP